MPGLRAVVLPGGGVAPPRSPLDPVVRALEQQGYDVRRVWWDAPRAVRDPHSTGAADDWVRAQVDRAVIGWDDPVLVVAKSLGTRAAPCAAERGWPAIWLTPLLVADPVVAGIRANPARQLLVGGTADPWWDGAVAADLGSESVDVLEVPGADHALEVDGRPTDLDLAGVADLFLRSLPAVRP